LFTHGGFDRDPVIEFDARFPVPQHDQRPFCVELKKDAEFFFRGLGVMPSPGTTQPVNWDKRLYAIDSSREEECFGFLGGIAFSAPARGFFGNTFSYDLQIPDPTSFRNDLLAVKIFGVFTNQAVVYLEQGLSGIPRVRTVATPADGKLPAGLHGKSIIGGFNGEDQLLMRDE
jgi:hypothetical protein